MNFYRVSFPYVAIIDPRTGELVRQWNKIDTLTFCDKLTQFLTDHPSPLEKDLTSIQNQTAAPESYQAVCLSLLNLISYHTEFVFLEFV